MCLLCCVSIAYAVGGGAVGWCSAARAQDTVTGFLLAGIGHRDKKGKVNFLVVDPESTRDTPHTTTRRPSYRIA